MHPSLMRAGARGIKLQASWRLAPLLPVRIMSSLIHLIYNSAATQAMSPSELAALLEQARNKNAAAGITGMLLHVDGCFFQVLEGPAAAVEAVVAQIAADPRHTRMTTIIKEPLAQRAFGEWTMGFAQMTAEELGPLEGLNDFFTAGHVLTEIDSGRAKKVLEAFRQGRWRVKLSAPAALNTAARGAGTADLAGPAAPARASTGAAEVPRPAFSMAYQPIVDASLGKVVGYEALVRADRHQPTAEVLQRLSLEEFAAFDEDARRMAIGLATRLGLGCQLHLNISPHLRLVAPRTLQTTLETGARCGLSASRLVFEIKHEATVNEPTPLAAWLQPCREQGVKISLDNFGSGYAGLALLDQLQPDMLSVGMWMLRGIEGHGPRQAILRGLAQTCTDLGIDIIAKGVETLEEYSWLRDEGITIFQGFLFAKAGFETLPRPMLPADLA